MASVTTSTEDATKDWRERREAVLRRVVGHSVEKLGEGEEAEVYALDAERVVRLFKPHVDPAYIARRRAFYAGLDASALPVAVPSIIEQGIAAKAVYSIESRMPGSSLADLLPRLEGVPRRAALVFYAEAATAIRRIGFERRDTYGEVMAVSAIRSDTWATYVLMKAEACLGKSWERLRDGVAEPERAMRTLGHMLSQHGPVERNLVHGDFYPANVIVDPDGKVAGVVDFGPLTLLGDWRLDAASALLYLTGMDGITEEDKAVVHAHLMTIGLRDQDVALYRLFYAFLFLDTKKVGLLDWCRATIEAACSA